MIRLSRRRDASSIPADFVGDRLIGKHLDLITRYYLSQTSGKPMAFASSKWKSAKGKVRADTVKKCAYCEAPTSTVAHGDVEHFRPKSLYWWLAYRFDNYLFACQICNQIYKSDHFPFGGAQRSAAPAMPALEPNNDVDRTALATLLARDATIMLDTDLIAEWLDEASELPNPYLEDPEPLFGFKVDVANNEVWLVSAGSERGDRAFAAAETYLGLNREELRKDRYMHFATLATFYESFRHPGLPAELKLSIEKQFGRLSAASHPFAAMHRFFLRSWGLL